MTDLAELLKQVKSLDIGTTSLVEGTESGDYRSGFRGGGIEFSEVREYVAGDDARRVDWNVSARYNDLFVKEFVEEKDLHVYVVMDMSASNDFGFVKSKRDLGLEIAASLMFSAMKNNDRVGLGLFTDSLEEFVPARRGRRHVIDALQKLLGYEPKSRHTDISRSLSDLQKHLRRRSMVFVVSDFMSDSFARPLRYLKTKHHIVLINVSDVRERELPEIGRAYLEDLESGEQILVNTSDKKFQERYSALVRDAGEGAEYEMKKLGVDFITLSNEEPFDVAFNRHIRRRRR